MTSIAGVLSFCVCVSLLGCNADVGSAPWINGRAQDANNPGRARDAGTLDADDGADDDGGSNEGDTDDAGAEDASASELRDADLPSDASEAELDAASDAASDGSTDGDDAGAARAPRAFTALRAWA